MSIKAVVARSVDAAAVARAHLVPLELRAGIKFCPVLHVEQLDNNDYFAKLAEYCLRYVEVTGKRVVATVMTPLSPLTRMRLSETRFPEELYSERILRIKELAIIGLHGHFVRRSQAGDLFPMHASFFNVKDIRSQVEQETAWLASGDMMDADMKIYSGGWWFSNGHIQRILVDNGYRYDFSIALGEYSWSQAAWIEERRGVRMGDAIRLSSAPELIACPGLSGTAVRGRPHACIWRLAAEGFLRSSSPAYLTFYGHDYDLPVKEAVEAVHTLQRLGFKFFEPSDLVPRPDQGLH